MHLRISHFVFVTAVAPCIQKSFIMQARGQILCWFDLVAVWLNLLICHGSAGFLLIKVSEWLTGWYFSKWAWAQRGLFGLWKCLCPLQSLHRGLRCLELVPAQAEPLIPDHLPSTTQSIPKHDPFVLMVLILLTEHREWLFKTLLRPG